MPLPRVEVTRGEYDSVVGNAGLDGLAHHLGDECTHPRHHAKPRLVECGVGLRSRHKSGMTEQASSMQETRRGKSISGMMEQASSMQETRRGKRISGMTEQASSMQETRRGVCTSGMTEQASVMHETG